VVVCAPMMIAASLELVGDVATVIFEIGKIVFQ
jgi:hypothetical protein